MNINKNETQYYTNRFRRPSNQLPLPNQFSFEDFEKDSDNLPLITVAFKTPEDVIKAYFGILKNASNMEGYFGGCGSIGNSLAPYPYAYELYTTATKDKMSLSDFIDSYRGIGHILLLMLYPTYTPSLTPSNICYYMFEIEAITGPSKNDAIAYKRGGSYFLYQYGLITVKNDSRYGWKIKYIDYLPEDFLCAPEHGWIYSSLYVVNFVYKDWYELIDTIYRIEQDGNLIYIYASGKGKQYRFDFVRLTNGYDILLHENISINGSWVETNIIKPQDQRLKFSPLNPNLIL